MNQTKDVGMLWLDDDKERPIEEKIRRAAAYMKEKYGRFPARIFTQMVQTSIQVNGITVEHMPNVLPHHLFLMFEGATDEKAN